MCNNIMAFLSMKKYFSIFDLYGWYGHLNVKFWQFWHSPNVFKICSVIVLCLLFLFQKNFYCRLSWCCWKYQKTLFFWTPDIKYLYLTTASTILEKRIFIFLNIIQYQKFVQLWSSVCFFLQYIWWKNDKTGGNFIFYANYLIVKIS